MSNPSKSDVVAVLRRYGVRNHYRATRESYGTRYAVFGPDGQMTEPASHAEAKEARDLLIAADLLELFGVEG